MSAHEKIAECKKEIQRAKRIRKNRQGKNMLRALDHFRDLLLMFYVENALLEVWLHHEELKPKYFTE